MWIFLLPIHYIDSIKPGKRPHTPFVVGGGHTLTSWAWQRIWEWFSGWFLKIDFQSLTWVELHRERDCLCRQSSFSWTPTSPFQSDFQAPRWQKSEKCVHVFIFYILDFVRTCIRPILLGVISVLNLMQSWFCGSSFFRATNCRRKKMDLIIQVIFKLILLATWGVVSTSTAMWGNLKVWNGRGGGSSYIWTTKVSSYI